jgi:hypothetical protein
MRNKYPSNVVAYYDFHNKSDINIDVSGKNNNIMQSFDIEHYSIINSRDNVIHINNGSSYVDIIALKHIGKNTIEFKEDVNINILLVGGGGGGSYSGGGGGGVIYRENINLTKGLYNFEVGDGGIGDYAERIGTNGKDTIFYKVTENNEKIGYRSLGGGGGGGSSMSVLLGNNGGSGGGSYFAGNITISNAISLEGQGNNGGAINGGGGGAGFKGVDSIQGRGMGGYGRNFSNNFSKEYGDNGWFGGGGNGPDVITRWRYKYGGGGIGNGENGKLNTGGGGGGGSDRFNRNNSTFARIAGDDNFGNEELIRELRKGGNGGSGIILIKINNFIEDKDIIFSELSKEELTYKYLVNDNALHYLKLDNLLDEIKETNNFSISGWFYSQNIIEKQTLLSFSNKNNNNIELILYIENEKLIFLFKNKEDLEDIQFKITTHIITNKWYNFILSFDNNGNNFYLNNKHITNYEIGNSVNNNPIKDIHIDTFNIGCSEYIENGITNYNNRLLNCFLSDIIIFNTSINLELVKYLYEDNYGYDIYLLMGQSNMIGRAPIQSGIDDNYQNIKNKVYQFPFDKNWMDGNDIIEVRNPLDHITTVPGGTDGEINNQTGLWKTFSENIINNSSLRRKILLVPLAKGGTSFSNNNWNKGNEIYNSVVHTINNSYQTHPLNKIVGILWHQGEGDIYNENYLDNLNNMYNSLKEDILGFTDDIKFVLGEIKRIDTLDHVNKSKKFNNNLRKFVNQNNNTFLVKTFDDEKVFDGIHFDTKSLRSIGIKYANYFTEDYNNELLEIESDYYSEDSDIGEWEINNEYVSVSEYLSNVNNNIELINGNIEFLIDDEEDQEDEVDEE